MTFTIKCNECGCTDVDLDVFNEKILLICGACDNEQDVINDKEVKKGEQNG